jgi:uncharacterized NAD(P)/FAD-binding protein YdhS
VTEAGSVAIIGLGSRGLNVLERVLALAEQAGKRLRIELIDPVGDGAGMHAVDQPDYLLLNTICSQVSMFPDRCSVGDTVQLTGPSLYEWAVERELRIAEDGFSVGAYGRRINPWDFLPRRLLGEYLGWFMKLLLARLPVGVEVRLHRSQAIRLAEVDEQLRIELASGEGISVGHVFLSLGHPENVTVEHPSGRLIRQPYPMPERLSRVSMDDTVAISGFGLTAMDALSCLTVGRGGRYERRGKGLRYLPSGAEPRLLFYSRSGRPCRARPRVLRYGPGYRALLFTPSAIDRLRVQHGGTLDFDRHVWPLVLGELRIAFRRAEARAFGESTEEQLEQRLTEATCAGTLDQLLDSLDAERGRFSPEHLLDGSQPMSLADSAGYQAWLAAELATDLAEGEMGLQGSVIKQTLDILRELRDTFRYAVDFGGLTPESNRSFFQYTTSVLNRAVVGPQFERHEELLALLQLGVAEAPFGPDPVLNWDRGTDSWLLESQRLARPHVDRADWLLAGRTDLPAVGSSASPLLDALFREGMIRPNPAAEPQLAGIEVDRDQHPIRASGESDRRIWVLGPLCEGSTFYNNLVPSPGSYSRPIVDAHRCATQLLTADLPLSLA